MSRKFAPISLDLLGKKLEPYGDHELVDLLKKDLKVEFDLENVIDEHPNLSNLLGYHTLDNGLTFFGMAAGGDWEHPVFFIVYWDGKKLRAYIPTDGNPWNTTTKMAYGNDPEADYQNAVKRGYWVADEEDDVEGFDVVDYVDFDEALIKQDIVNRIQKA